MKLCVLVVRLLTAAAAIALPESAMASGEGDPESGREIYLDRTLGHCVLCHRAAQIDAPFQGNLGPDLTDVSSRLTVTELRAKVEDPTVSNPESAMPAFRRIQGLRQVANAHAGEPILNAGQLVDLLAFLATLDGTTETMAGEP